MMLSLICNAQTEDSLSNQINLEDIRTMQPLHDEFKEPFTIGAMWSESIETGLGCWIRNITSTIDVLETSDPNITIAAKIRTDYSPTFADKSIPDNSSVLLLGDIEIKVDEVFVRIIDMLLEQEEEDRQNTTDRIEYINYIADGDPKQIGYIIEEGKTTWVACKNIDRFYYLFPDSEAFRKMLVSLKKITKERKTWNRHVQN